MPSFQTHIFIGSTPAEATALLDAALRDGSFPVVPDAGAMWITHREVIPGAMQPSSYELHVTAWVETP